MLGDYIRNPLQELWLGLRTGNDTLSLASSVARTIFGDSIRKSFVAMGFLAFLRVTQSMRTFVMKRNRANCSLSY